MGYGQCNPVCQKERILHKDFGKDPNITPYAHPDDDPAIHDADGSSFLGCLVSKAPKPWAPGSRHLPARSFRLAPLTGGRRRSATKAGKLPRIWLSGAGSFGPFRRPGGPGRPKTSRMAPEVRASRLRSPKRHIDIRTLAS